MAYLDSDNVDELVADIKDLADQTYAKIEDIPEAAISTPLPDSQAGSVGSSTKYAKEDHSHHILSFRYTETSGSFLDWCYTQFPTNQDNTINGCFYVVFETANYTDWPTEELGTALVQRRNNDIYIIAFTSSNLIYTNKKNGGDAQWNGWKRLAKTTDIPLAGNSNPLPNGRGASVGSSSNYSRADHVHPFTFFKFQDATGSFLDWCLSTFLNDSTVYGSYFVIHETSNYTGWPIGETGYALVQRRNNNIYIIVHTTSNLLYTNRYSPDAQTWYGWEQIARTDFIPDASSLTPLADNATGAVGTSTSYARADHKHPISTPVTFTCTATTSVVERGECKGIYDPNSGLVRLSGYVSNTSHNITTSENMFTIPEAYRPKANASGYGIFVTSSNAISSYFLTAYTTGYIRQGLTSSLRQVSFYCEYAI